MYNYVQTIWFAEYTLSNKEKMSVVVLGTVMSAFPACVMVRDSSRRWNVWTELLHVPACSLAATFFSTEPTLCLFRLPVRAHSFGQNER